jgi:hypothetical protein
MNEPVPIELTGDEALVLFELLSRFSDTNTFAIEDQAEARALWNLLCLLQKRLVAPFRPDYREILSQARDRLRDPVE